MRGPERRILHEIEQVVVATDDVADVGGNRQIEVGQIIRVAESKPGIWNVIYEDGQRCELVQEKIDPFLGKVGELRPDLRPRQYILDFRKDRRAEVELDLI